MAKYKLSDLLGNSHTGDALSMLFLQVMTKEMTDSIVQSYEGKTNEEIQAMEVDIDLRVNGKEVDPKRFFHAYDDQYEQMIKDTVHKMLEEKKWTIMESLNLLVESAEGWKRDNDWEIRNPFVKSKDQ